MFQSKSFYFMLYIIKKKYIGAQFNHTLTVQNIYDSSRTNYQFHSVSMTSRVYVTITERVVHSAHISPFTKAAKCKLQQRML